MADFDPDPFEEHESRTEEPMGENIPFTPVGEGPTWKPECEQEMSFGRMRQRSELKREYVKGLYKKLSENLE